MKRIVKYIKKDWGLLWRAAVISAMSGGLTGFLLSLAIKYLLS